jgi:hypothetical protein
MAFLQYGGVSFNMARTHNVSFDPVMDASGLDYLNTKIRIEVAAVFNPVGTATDIAVAGQGDRLGVSLYALRDTLMTPRQALVLNVGQDMVIRSPAFNDQGLAMASDAQGGPFPRSFRVMEITGDKSAIIFYVIETYLNYCANYVLSNRWSVQTVTDYVGGMTTRIINGRAKFRLDLLNDDKVDADSFRKNLILPAGTNMVRKQVHIQVTADGSELSYRVVDQEVKLNLGKTKITRIEGNATVGVDSPIKDVQALVNKAVGFGAGAIGALQAAFNGRIGDAFVGAGRLLVNTVVGLLPTVRANCIVRVFGQKKAPLNLLADRARQIAFDRFAPLALGKTLFIVSCYLTQDLGNENEPFVEMRFEFLVANLNGLAAMLDPTKVPALMNLDTEISLDGGRFYLIEAPPDQKANSELPFSNNTRGYWLGQIAAAAMLVQPCQDPIQRNEQLLGQAAPAQGDVKVVRLQA